MCSPGFRQEAETGRSAARRGRRGKGHAGDGNHGSDRPTDLEASIRFYTGTVGFALAFRHEDFCAGIRAGKDIFHFKRIDAKDPSIAFVEAGNHFHLYFETKDARMVAEALARKGVRLVKEGHDTPWGSREFAIHDDQGHTLYVGERR